MDIAIRALVLYVFVTLLMRVIGRRELSSLAPSDLVLLIVLGDAVQQGLTQDDYSVTGAVIAISSVAALQVLSSWFAFRSRRARRVLEGEPIVVIQEGRLIDKNLRREKRVALTILDPENPYRYLGVQGRVVEMTEQGADAHIDQMAKKYLNKDKYPFRAPGEVRVIVKIKPEKVHANG